MSITLLACEMSASVRSFEHSLALPFFGIGMKTDLSSPVATAAFYRFAAILSAALIPKYSPVCTYTQPKKLNYLFNSNLKKNLLGS